MNQTRFKIVVITLTTIIIVAFVIRSYLISDISDKGIILSGIEKETQSIKGENMLLKDQILYYQALSTIEREAREDGYVNATYVILSPR